MYSKRYYEIQLQTFTELRKKCTHKPTLKKFDELITRYKRFINEYEMMEGMADECHCDLCVMQG